MDIFDILFSPPAKDVQVLEKGVEALKRWNGKADAQTVYDSRVDPFTDDGLFNEVKGKADIGIVCFTDSGDVFGGFYSVAVTEQDKAFFDPSIFAFSFESHGRCVTPQRFRAKNDAGSVFVAFWKNHLRGYFVEFDGGRGYFGLGNEKVKTWSYNLTSAFQGLDEKTLTGKAYDSIHCVRLVAVHLF